jgi:Na+/melibiose symporter-like transporter
VAATVNPQQQRLRVALSVAMTAALLLAFVVPLLIALTATDGNQATIAVCVVLGVCLAVACLCRVLRERLERSVAEVVDVSISDVLTELNASLLLAVSFL